MPHQTNVGSSFLQDLFRGKADHYEGDLRMVPRSAASAYLGSLFEMPILRPSLDLLNQRLRECCPATYVLKSHVGDSDGHENSADHKCNDGKGPFHKSIYLPRED